MRLLHRKEEARNGNINNHVGIVKLISLLRNATLGDRVDTIDAAEMDDQNEAMCLPTHIPLADSNVNQMCAAAN